MFVNDIHIMSVSPDIYNNHLCADCVYENMDVTQGDQR